MRIECGTPLNPSLFGSVPDANLPMIPAIATDSREVMPGDLFLALPGAKDDGADHIAEAYARGAAVVLSHRIDEYERTIPVPDPLKTVTRVAKKYAASIPHRTVGITGSYGKTTLRENLTRILSRVIQTVSTPGNGNTDLAVALSLLTMKADTRLFLAELGMRGRGEIARLSDLIRPDLAVVTAIGSAHIGRLGSREEICRAKCEITEGMNPDGCLLYPSDDPMLSDAVAKLPVRHETVSVGSHSGTYSLVLQNASERTVELSSPDGSLLNVRLPAVSRPFLSCAAFSFAVCKKLGVGNELIETELSRLSLPPMRQEIRELAGRTVILDCYNASPESCRAALDLVARYRENGRRVHLVLGDMLELGDASERYHQEIGRKAASLFPVSLSCIGDLARWYSIGATKAGLSPDRVFRYRQDEKQEVARTLWTVFQKGDVLLLKGSRALALEDVFFFLEKLSESDTKG